MEPLDVLAVMLICGTVILIAYWLFTKTITIKHVHHNEDLREPVPIPVNMSEAERKKLEEELNKSTIAQRSMDEVIRAANEMMGISPLDDGGANGQE